MADRSAAAKKAQGDGTEGSGHLGAEKGTKCVCVANSAAETQAAKQPEIGDVPH